MRILILGDVVGKSGRCALKRFIEKDTVKFDILIVNVENSAGGFGITVKIFNELKSAGVDFMTSGNHIWDKKEAISVLNEFSDSIIRPANYPPGVAGKGFSIIEKNGKKIGIINLLGRVFMEPLDDPFRKSMEIIDFFNKNWVNIIIIDFHAEATAEKQALGWYLDGKVSAIVGTHTHVQTSDERLLENGTFYISDLGMCGSVDSVIGTKIEDALYRFNYLVPHTFTVASGNEEIQGILLEINEEDGKVNNFKRIKEKVLCN